MLLPASLLPWNKIYWETAVIELSLLPQPQRDGDEVALEGRSMWMKEEVSGAPWPWKSTKLVLVFVIAGCRDACSAPSALKELGYIWKGLSSLQFFPVNKKIGVGSRAGWMVSVLVCSLSPPPQIRKINIGPMKLRAEVSLEITEGV